MCGRFVDPNLLGTEFELREIKITPISRRFNVKPTQDIYIDHRGEILTARWGLIPFWHKGELKDWKASTINARIEEVEEKATFRSVWKSGRCLIPVGGYYEWTGEKGSKQPHFFQSAGNEETLWFAGLVSEWRDLLTCTIMTRAANQWVEPVHDRMPVILSADEREAWLAGSTDKEIGAGARVRHHPVAPFGIKDEGPELIEA